jgi:3-oxoacyl-[acyl-carrier protein] reductase
MARLKNKVAIVTGAASGFGEGIAMRFAEEGAKIVVADINVKGADRVARAIGKAAIAVQTDVGLAIEFDEMVNAAMTAFGRIDIMVNNAGFTHRKGPLAEVDEDTFDLIAAVNMKAIYHAARRVVPIMEKQGGGVFLTTASTAGTRPRPGLTWFSASKAWAISATKSMALELASKNIRVNCICPFAGDTAMLPKLLGSGSGSDAARDELVEQIPMRRMASPLDVANAALYLASDEAALVTGVALEVDGGGSI